jgi:hypothetical protein
VPRRVCSATTAAGVGCTFPALRTGELCFQHAPETTDERRLARLRGGINATAGRRISGEAPERYKSVEELDALLDETLNRLRRLPVSPSTANALVNVVTAKKTLVEIAALAALQRRIRGPVIA